MAYAVDANLHAVMHEPVSVHASTDACFVEKLDRSLLDDSGAHAAKDICAGLAFQNDVVDAVLVEKLAEQKPGRAGADNGDLSARLNPHASS